MTLAPVTPPKQVVTYKGFEKRRNVSRSSTLGQEQFHAREQFGYEPSDYIRHGQGKARPGKYGFQRRSGSSGGTFRVNPPEEVD